MSDEPERRGLTGDSIRSSIELVSSRMNETLFIPSSSSYLFGWKQDRPGRQDSQGKKNKEDVEDEGMKRNKEEKRKMGRRLGRDNQYTPHTHTHTYYTLTGTGVSAYNTYPTVLPALLNQTTLDVDAFVCRAWSTLPTA